jgi:hypothetical protein
MDRDGRRLPGFVSFKTTRPIAYRSRWMRTALMLATFNHEVFSLAPGWPAGTSVNSSVMLAFTTASGASLILLSDDQALQTTGGTEVVHKSDILKLPFAADCEAIWAHRTQNVGAMRRMAIAAALPEGVWLQIGDLQRRLGAPHDEMRSLFALIAQGRIEINVAQALSPSSWVRISSTRAVSGSGDMSQIRTPFNFATRGPLPAGANHTAMPQR